MMSICFTLRVDESLDKHKKIQTEIPFLSSEIRIKMPDCHMGKGKGSLGCGEGAKGSVAEENQK